MLQIQGPDDRVTTPAEYRSTDPETWLLIVSQSNDS